MLGNWTFLLPTVISQPKKVLNKTSRPKASSGQRYPCPASLYWRRSSFGKQGSGPDRGRSPVEWGDFPYVRPSVHPSVRPFRPWALQPALGPAGQASGSDN